MPNRIFSDRAWMSDKLAQVNPDCFRAEYAWIYSLALCDGTFECDAKKIWAACYATVREIDGRWTPRRIQAMLDEFDRVGLLKRKADRDGKIWGFWVGCESLLPPRGHWFKYKRGKGFLFMDGLESLYPEDIKPIAGHTPDNSRLTSRPVLGVGFGSVEVLVAVGDKPAPASEFSVGDVLEETLAEAGSTADKGKPCDLRFTYRRGLYPGTDPKKIFAHIARAWTRVRGEAAVCRYPSKYPENWERLCDSHSGDILVPAFELWATKHGYDTDMPITEFIKVAGEYMKLIVPLKDVKPKTTVEDVKVAADTSLAARDALFSDEKTETTEPGPEAF